MNNITIYRQRTDVVRLTGLYPFRRWNIFVTRLQLQNAISDMLGSLGNYLINCIDVVPLLGGVMSRTDCPPTFFAGGEWSENFFFIFLKPAIICLLSYDFFAFYFFDRLMTINTCYLILDVSFSTNLLIRCSHVPNVTFFNK